MTSQIWWYLARSSGVIAWLMLTASVVWGVLLSTKAFPGRRRPAWLLDLHRWLGALTLAFIGLHVVALMADSYVQFDPVDVLLPFASSWRPFAVALGVIAGWLLVAVQVSSLAIKRLPKSVWRGIHLTSYATFWIASLHAVLAGTDRGQPLYLWTAAIGMGAVAWSTVYRLTHRRPVRTPRTPTPAPVPGLAPMFVPPAVTSTELPMPTEPPMSSEPSRR